MMKKELIAELFGKFEEACYDFEGMECWSARELQGILGYRDWRNFSNAIKKAGKSCQESGELIENHFLVVAKTITIGNGTES